MKTITDWLGSNVVQLTNFYKILYQDLIIRNKKNPSNKICFRYNDILLKKKRFQFNKDLPFNFDFEIEKIKNQFFILRPKKILLQLPQGLLNFLPNISYLIFSDCYDLKKIFLSNTLTYGACNIDDVDSKTLGLCFVIHYGHTCIIKIKRCLIPIIYIFVEINFDDRFFYEKFLKNLCNLYKFYVVETVQYRTKAFFIYRAIKKLKSDAILPKIQPLSHGEILGCTTHSDKFLKNFIYIGDGRFHPEGLILSNPGSKIMQYNPLTKQIINFDLKISEVLFYREHQLSNTLLGSKIIGFIKGSMGRQGSFLLYRKIEYLIKKLYNNQINIVLSEIDFFLISLFEEFDIDFWTQNSCPRLSVDWGVFFIKPMITMFELLNLTKIFYKNKKKYPMNFYSDTIVPWSNNYDNKYIRKLT